MVKGIVVLMLVGGVGIWLAYHYGGAKSFDPTAQGRQAKAALQQGMTWQQAVDAAGPPVQFSCKHLTKRGGMEMIEDGAPTRWDRPLFEQTFATSGAPYGFRLIYNFSAQAAFSAHFDRSGKLEEVADDKTVADLLDTRK
jgi:hypothetical protein